MGTQRQSAAVAVFWEPGFPAIEDCKVTQETLQQSLAGFAASFLNERDLIAQLDAQPFDLLITPYGSAFPKRAWNVLLKFLRAGGNWLNLGGIPLSRPALRVGGAWRVESHKTSYHKQLGITHSFPVKGNAVATYVDQELGSSLKADEIYELYVRLSSTNNEPDESGSDGPHEGIVKPIVLGLSVDGRPIAAPVIQIDRLLADFSGGRWMLANFRGSLNAKGLRTLAQIAAQGASRFEVRSEFACYREQETPSFSVRLSRPRGDVEKLARNDCRVEVRDQNDRVVSSVNVPLNVESKIAVGSFKLPETTKLPPGFHKVIARTSLNSTLESTSSYETTHTTGFWIYDEAPADTR